MTNTTKSNDSEKVLANHESSRSVIDVQNEYQEVVPHPAISLVEHVEKAQGPTSTAEVSSISNATTADSMNML